MIKKSNYFLSDIMKGRYGRYVDLVGPHRKDRFQALVTVIMLCPWGRHFITVIRFYKYGVDYHLHLVTLFLYFIFLQLMLELPM